MSHDFPLMSAQHAIDNTTDAAELTRLHRLEIRSLLLAFESHAVRLYDLQREDTEYFYDPEQGAAIARTRATLERVREAIIAKDVNDAAQERYLIAEWLQRNADEIVDWSPQTIAAAIIDGEHA